MYVETVPIDRLSLSPTNPRENDHAVPHVVASLRRFGFRQPVVAKRSGEVIAGNTRLKAARELGLEEIPVHWFEGDDLEATAYAIADNRTGEFADWDEPALAQLLRELREEDQLEGVGYETAEIDEILASLDTVPTEVDDPGPEAPSETPVSRTGDLWILGEHRLLCGDSTNTDDMTRLMDGDTARLLSTDPPYGVDYTGDDRPDGSGKDWSDTYREVEIDDFGAFLRRMFGATLPHVADDAGVYLWHAHVQYATIDAVLEEFDILRHQMLVWQKPTSTFTHSYYRWQHEPCVFGWKRGHKPPRHSEDFPSTVWEADWDGKQRVSGNDHPTQKPLRIFEIPIEMHTRRSEVILEPFSGSGSQLIAAERLGRRCRAMEKSPAFVDVAVKRWEAATGQKAHLDNDNRTMAAIGRDRGASQK